MIARLRDDAHLTIARHISANDFDRIRARIWILEINRFERVFVVERSTASGESEIHSNVVRDQIDLGGIRYVQWDCTRAGGLTEGLRIAAYALAHGVQIAYHHDPQVHGPLMAAQSHGFCVESFPSIPRDPFWHHVLTKKPELKAGKVTLTDDPGFGVDVDWKMVEKYRV